MSISETPGDATPRPARGIDGRARDLESQRLLADAGRILASSLDYEMTLDGLASVVVPALGDYCFIDVLRDDGSVQRVGRVAGDPAKEAIARDLQRYPPTFRTASPAIDAMRSGEPLLVSDVSEALVVRAAQSEEHLRLLRAFAVRSFMMAPMRTRGRTMGLLSVGSFHAERPAAPAGLDLLTEIAVRAALALDNALLYRHAQETNRLKDEFLATLSHELRTPLNSLLGWAQILRMQLPATESAHRAIDSIDRSARAQLVLINDLLDVSRVISGKLRLNQQRVDIAGVVALAIESVGPAMRAKDINLGVSIAPLRLEVTGDSDRLQQVVSNLLTNALKFTPPGGRIDVVVDEPGSAVQIKVRDTGIGIDHALVPYIFDRFRQGDSSTTRAHSGLGLGLAIVRHLVDLHGGSVAVESDGPDHGACFTVTLPASMPAAIAPMLPIAPQNARGTLDGVQILAVDDDPDARELVLLALQRAGARVVAVACVEDALRALDSTAPDVVVADIAMPYRDGYELLREIRGRFSAPACPPVIAVTACASPEDAERASAAGFARHLAKPIDYGALVQSVVECVRRV